MTTQPTFAGMRLIDANAVRESASSPAAADALEAVLAGGFDTDDDAQRVRVTTPQGVLLVMPSALGAVSGTKLLTQTDDNRERGLPLLQGVYVLFGGEGQEPLALLDGMALTELRTPAVSLVALRHLAPAPRGPEHVLVFGSGVQGTAHARAIAADREVASLTIADVDAHSARERAAQLSAELTLPVTGVAVADAGDAVARADIICTCTPSSEPLFDGALVRDGAVVVAMGSHFPDARETDDALVARAAVVVESRTGILAEAGDVIMPIDAGVLDPASLTTFGALVREGRPRGTGPFLFKFTGQPWEDLVVADAVHRSVAAAAQ